MPIPLIGDWNTIHSLTKTASLKKQLNVGFELFFEETFGGEYDDFDSWESLAAASPGSAWSSAKAWAKALPSFYLADDDYVAASFTSLEASSKSSYALVF